MSRRGSLVTLKILQCIHVVFFSEEDHVYAEPVLRNLFSSANATLVVGLEHVMMNVHLVHKHGMLAHFDDRLWAWPTPLCSGSASHLVLLLRVASKVE